MAGQYDTSAAKAATKDFLERARRLRVLATEATTAHLRAKLLEDASECERLAGLPDAIMSGQ
jgi:hypothetical protein